MLCILVNTYESLPNVLRRKPEVLNATSILKSNTLQLGFMSEFF